MLDREIRTLFEEEDQRISIDERKRNEAMAFIGQKVEEKEKTMQVDRLGMIMSQIQYMDKSMLWIQIVVECIVIFLFLRFGYYETSQEDVLAYSIICSGVLGVLLPAAMHRSFANNVAELSETCYFNAKQIMVFQMAYSGILCLALLAGGIFFVGIRWKISFIRIGLYVVAPFAFSGCCCLGAMLTEVGRRTSYMFVVVGLFLGVFYIVLVSFTCIYQVSALLFWGIALIVGVCLFGIQLHILFQDIDKGEILCMN